MRIEHAWQLPPPDLKTRSRTGVTEWILWSWTVCCWNSRPSRNSTLHEAQLITYLRLARLKLGLLN
ncbi:MAG: hypothetical protein JWR15_3935 [Prosthecobacter sp.]|nr:hypothetical protein [Prosthecobacter sp.]